MTKIALSDPFNTIWYHGTDAAPFARWQCPPPALSPADVSHTALFFAASREFAREAGSNVCTIKLRTGINLIAPACRGAESRALRLSVVESGPLAKHCVWLRDDAAWAASWSTGEVMRFSIDLGDRPAVRAYGIALASLSANLKKIIRTPLSDDVIAEQAVTCLRRGWIEQLVCSARELGYQAIHGAEIDFGSRGDSSPLPEEWLAVLYTSVVTDPAWQRGDG